MSDQPGMVAAGSCFRCPTVFTYDVEFVPSVIVDGATGKSVIEGAPMPADPVRKPLCDACADWVEAQRAEAGLPIAFPLRHRRSDPLAL